MSWDKAIKFWAKLGKTQITGPKMQKSFWWCTMCEGWGLLRQHYLFFGSNRADTERRFNPRLLFIALSYDTARQAACPSAHPSHAGNASKLTTVGSCGFHRQVARNSSFRHQLSYPRFEENPLQKLQTRLRWVKRRKTEIFNQ